MFNRIFIQRWGGVIVLIPETAEPGGCSRFFPNVMLKQLCFNTLVVEFPREANKMLYFYLKPPLVIPLCCPWIPCSNCHKLLDGIPLIFVGRKAVRVRVIMIIMMLVMVVLMLELTVMMTFMSGIIIPSSACQLTLHTRQNSSFHFKHQTKLVTVLHPTKVSGWYHLSQPLYGLVEIQSTFVAGIFFSIIWWLCDEFEVSPLLCQFLYLAWISGSCGAGFLISVQNIKSYGMLWYNKQCLIWNFYLIPWFDILLTWNFCFQVCEDGDLYHTITGAAHSQRNLISVVTYNASAPLSLTT